MQCFYLRPNSLGGQSSGELVAIAPKLDQIMTQPSTQNFYSDAKKKKNENDIDKR